MYLYAMIFLIFYRLWEFRLAQGKRVFERHPGYMENAAFSEPMVALADSLTMGYNMYARWAKAIKILKYLRSFEPGLAQFARSWQILIE